MTDLEITKIEKDDEIDLLELFDKIRSNYLILFKWGIVASALGVVVALSSKVEYKAYCRLLPEVESSLGGNLGGLGGLAGLAGFNLNMNSTTGLSPDIYPEIISSFTFQHELLMRPIRFEKIDTIMSCYDYFIEIDKPPLYSYILGYTIGLPFKIKNFLSDDTTVQSYQGESDQLPRFSKNDWEIIEGYRERIEIESDLNTGIISVSVELPDPYASAEMVNVLVHNLIAEVENYKSKKARKNLSFVEEQFKESEESYKKKQLQLAKYVDRNRNVSSALYKVTYERLRDEVAMSFEVYKGLASQFEQAKITLKEETPVFTILEPVRIPESKSRPRRGFIVSAFAFLGLLAGTVYVLLKK